MSWCYQKIIFDSASKFWYNICMNEMDLAYLAWLGISCYGAWYLGKREGISVTLDYLKETKQIDFED